MKICISGDIIEEVISEAHERERVHHLLQQTWRLVLTTPYWWPTRRRDVWEYCQECSVCLDRNEGRIKEEEPKEEQGPPQGLRRKIKLNGERKYFQTQEPKQQKDWRIPYVQYLTKGRFRQGVRAKKKVGVQGIHSSHWWRGWDSPLQVYTMTWGQLTDNVFYSSL